MAEIQIRDTRLTRIWRNFAQFISVGLCTILYRIKAYNKENVPREGSVLILSNHQSFIDPMFSNNWIRRPFIFVARADLYHGFFGALLRSLYTIPIKQSQGDLAAMKAIIEVLKQGKAVCLYPEGSRSWDGRIAEIKPGFGLISRRSGAPILPMVIDGAFECWPRTRKLPRLFSRRVAVMYGKLIPVEHVKEVGDEAFAKELTEILRRMHGQLREKLKREPLDYSTPVRTD